MIFSLDGNSKNGLANLEKTTGLRLSGRSSEQILADHKLLNWDSDDLETQVKLLKEKIILDYDNGVLSETGKKLYAGSEFSDKTNALELVRASGDLFAEHWRAISEVQGRILEPATKEAYLEDMRRKTAAAIKLRQQGQIVGSIGDAEVAHEAETGEYGRECATDGMNQAENQLGDWERRVKNCPICGQANVLAVKKGEIISGSECGCWANVCTGESQKRNQPNNYDMFSYLAVATVAPKVVKDHRKTRVSDIYGEGAKLKKRTVFGDQETDVIVRDRVVELNIDKNYLSLAA